MISDGKYKKSSLWSCEEGSALNDYFVTLNVFSAFAVVFCIQTDALENSVLSDTG